MKYTFNVTTYQSGGEGQGDTKTDVGTDRNMSLYRKDRKSYGNIYHTPNRIGV